MTTKAAETHALLKARLAGNVGSRPPAAASAPVYAAAPVQTMPPRPAPPVSVPQVLPEVTEDLPPDERKSKRRPTRMGGVIQLDDGSHGIFCSVRDMSATGARLSLSSGNHYDFAARQRDVPPRFWLYIKQDRMQVPCEVIRRVGHQEIGVRFLAAPTFT